MPKILFGDPELAAVFGSYDDKPAWTSFISQYKNLMHHYVHQTSSESGDHVLGWLRRDAQERFSRSSEDLMRKRIPRRQSKTSRSGLKLTQSGHSIRLDKRIEVKHLKRWTIRNLLRADILYRAVPWTRLILNSRHLPRDLNLNYASRASSLLVGLLALVVCFCLLVWLVLSGCDRHLYLQRWG